MEYHERCFRAEIMYEVLYGVGADCLRLGSQEAEELGRRATTLANALFWPGNISEEGQNKVVREFETIRAELKVLQDKKNG